MTNRRDFILNSVAATGLLTLHAASKAAVPNCSPANTPMAQVDGKVAFITGGAGGIGLGIAQAFVAAGMKVVIADISAKALDEAKAQFAAAGQSNDVHMVRLDVTDRKGTEQAAAEVERVFGKVHVLVANAGVVVPTPLSKTTYDDWDWTLGVNLNGVFNSIHTFLPRIQAHGEGGHIIATSSNAGIFAFSSLGAYTPSKFAVVGLIETLRMEFAGTNIGASVYCPGPVLTKIMNSERNRPAALSDSGYKPKPPAAPVGKLPAPGDLMDPLEAGELVLQGMRNNDLYIITHPEYEKILQDRSELLLASLRRDLKPTEKRAAIARAHVQGSIYERELNRKKCPKT